MQKYIKSNLIDIQIHIKCINNSVSHTPTQDDKKNRQWHSQANISPNSVHKYKHQPSKAASHKLNNCAMKKLNKINCS